MQTSKNRGRFEWPTVALIVGCYALWAWATTALYAAAPVWAVAAGALAIAFHSSLQHEIIHGHPFRAQWLNEALVFPALTLVIPYLRFRDTHLAHHRDEMLTDPYDDPETNYLDEGDWTRSSPLRRQALLFNNTLLGRLTIGVLISQISFIQWEVRALRDGDVAVTRGWLWHLPALALVLAWLWWVAVMPIWVYLIAAYLGLSLVKIRTFLEHQAHIKASGRTVVIEDRGPLALLFLNNNYHVVHHMHPKVAWYELPGLYFANRERYLTRNGGYMYPSYGAVFRRYFFKRKDPVAHPLRRRDAP